MSTSATDRMSHARAMAGGCIWRWARSLCGLYVFKAPFQGSGPVINGLGLYGVIGVVAGIRIHKPKAATAWWFMAGGLALFFLGDVYTYSYPKLTGADVPFPSPGDAMYIGVYPVLMIGLLLLVRRRNQRADGPGVVDSVIMSVGLSLVSFLFLIAPYIHDGTMSLIPKLVSIAYPTGDLILLAAAIRLAVDAGKRRPSFYLLIASIVTLLLTDFVYGILTLNGTYTTSCGSTPAGSSSTCCGARRRCIPRWSSSPTWRPAASRASPACASSCSPAPRSSRRCSS